jgi:CxxC motif-containing protein (DUF1111 family)
VKRLVVIIAVAGCAGEPGGYEPGEEFAGGDTTVFDATGTAYANAAANLVGERRDGFFVGNSIFNRNWVVAPASTSGVDGLGPTFNATSCSACHFRDGRGRPPAPGEPMRSMLLRLDGDAVYGGQLQNASIPGVPAEGRVEIDWEEVPGAYGDGTPYSLRRPSYRFEDLAFGPLAAGVRISPRVAPATFGLGLLEAIPEDAIVAVEDPDDADGDGVSGRASRVDGALGRFGWSGGQPSVRQQSAAAFLGDIGITSSLFPEQNCPPAQTACAAAIDGGSPELDEGKLDDLTYYGQTLAVPGRRDARDPAVLRGKARFHDAGCASCHVPRWETGAHEVPEVAGQTIWPYTDLLLHDLGDGEEWRTPPLWGIGLVEVVNDHDLLLHDGRARGLAEAILWHGGEAEAAREAFRMMAADERDDLLRFLGSL